MERLRDNKGRFIKSLPYETISGTEGGYTIDELYTDKRRKEVIKMENDGKIKARDLVATPNGKFNWLGLLIELAKVAITFITANVLNNV